MASPVRCRHALWFLFTWSCAALAASAQEIGPDTYAQKVRTFYTAEEFARVTAGKVQIDRRIDPTQEAALRRGFVQLPSTQFTVIRAASASVVWIGTREGAIRVSGDYRTREYFSGQRWLPDDHVTGIGFEGDAAWLETRGAMPGLRTCR